ncbi:XRE family transcriptional regulator [Paraburkholderia sp. BR14320]|uniref:XRE family transcriptional regulator n=1 Tax=unclassified Paraburkholderia TaxID=2615204 RepID=UPI0034CEC821
MAHPKTSQKTQPMKAESPTPEEVREARRRTNLTIAEAAALIHAANGSWVKWERGERPMHPAFWELFLLKTQLIPLPEPEPKTRKLISF